MNSVKSWLGRGVMALILLMPFHAFLSVWLGQSGGRLIIQAWKEILIVILAGGALVQLARDPAARRLLQRPYNIAALVYILISLAASFWQQPVPLAWLFGIKTNLVWVGLFLIAQLASNPKLIRRALQAMLMTSLVVAAVALLQTWAIPPAWLEALGYSPQTINPTQLVDPAVAAKRAFSTLGGPNQLGAYLLLPFCYVIALATARLRLWHIPAGLLLSTAIAVSYSRSAWLGALAGLIVTAAAALQRRGLVALGAATAAVILVGLWLVPYLINHNPNAQYYLLHGSVRDTGIKTSNQLRQDSINRGVEQMRQQPAGRGLGTAGPASHYAGDTFITENYYLQLGVEVGVLGLAAYLAWQAMLTRRFWKLREAAPARALLGTLAGVAVVNLFLHGWADSTLALVFAALAGLVVNWDQHVAAD